MHEEMLKNSKEFYKMVWDYLFLEINDVRYKMNNEQTKQYVHLLNSTLTATERAMCCILENYQREDGVEIPEVLREFMGGKSFMPFLAKPEKNPKGKNPSNFFTADGVLRFDNFFLI